MLGACATTKATDVFRFEVRELKMTFYNDESKNKEKELKIIRGDTDKNATIVYFLTGISAEDTSGIISLTGSGEDSEGRVTTKGEKDNVIIQAKGTGVVRLSAYVLGKENVADSIVITIENEMMSAFSVTSKQSSIVVGESIDLNSKVTTKALPNSIADTSISRYTIDNEEVATLNGTILQGKKVGTVQVTAYSNYDSSFYATFDIRVVYAQAGRVDLYDKNDEDVDLDEEVNIHLINGDEENGAFLIKYEVVPEAAYRQYGTQAVDQTVTITSSNDKCVKIERGEDKSFVIRAVAAGVAKVTVESKDEKAKQEIVVEVRWPQTTELNLKKDTIDLKVKKNETIEIESILPKGANETLDISYNDPEDEAKNIISLADNKVTGVAPGTVVLKVSTIESEGNTPIEKLVTVNVTYDTLTEIKPSSDISLLTGDSSFVEGQMETKVTWSLVPAGSDPAVTLTSSDETIAKVAADGTLTIFDKVGSAEITITSDVNPEIKATILVEIKNRPGSFTLEGPEDESEFTYVEDLTIEVTVKIEPDNAPQDLFDVEVESENDDFRADIDIQGNKIIISILSDVTAEFYVIVTVEGVTGEQFLTYTVLGSE